MTILLDWMDKPLITWAQSTVTQHHYLQTPVDARCSVQGYRVRLVSGSGSDHADRTAGLLLFGRPEATKCYPWYGSVEDTIKGRAEVTRWQVLNLARVWFEPKFQPGGICYSHEYLPGFVDRKGQFRSTLVSSALALAFERIGFDYLIARPSCFLEEPYQLDYLLSYCHSNRHKGTIYQTAGFELYRTNKKGLQTYRKRLQPLLASELAKIEQTSLFNQRSQKYRAERQFAGAQLAMEM
jgi:hypothetical protein